MEPEKNCQKIVKFEKRNCEDCELRSFQDEMLEDTWDIDYLIGLIKKYWKSVVNLRQKLNLVSYNTLGFVADE